MSEKRGENSVSADKVAISTKKLLGDLTHKKIKYYLSKSTINDSELYFVFRHFFKELLELDYEFTGLELQKELEKIFLEPNIRTKLTKFVNKVTVIEYKDEVYNEEEIRELFKEFDELVQEIIKNTGKEDKKNFLEWIHKFLPQKNNRKEEQIIPEIEKEEIAIKKISEEKKEEKKEEKNKIKNKKEQVEKKENVQIYEFLQQENTKTEEKNIPNSIEEEESETTKVIESDLEELEKQMTNIAITEKRKEYRHVDWDKDVVEVEKENPVDEVTDDWAKEPIINQHQVDSDSSKKTELEDKEYLLAISEGETSLKEMLQIAKKTKNDKILVEQYKELLKKYNSLEDFEKEKYYDDINLIYEKLSKNN